MNLETRQFEYGSDNYGVLLFDPASGETALVDAGDADAALGAVADTGWTPTSIWITHHHHDHVGGLATIAEATGATVFGPGAIDGVTAPVGDGDSITLGDHEVAVIATPGHTLDMLNYHLPGEGLLFTGDTLFAMGCGRLFEGDADTMWRSLNRLMALDDSTLIYCGHEYTLANAEFALSIEPGNEVLVKRAKEVRAMREAGKPTVPTPLSLERKTNPFLRAGESAIRATLGMRDASDAEVFAEIRARKDRF